MSSQNVADAVDPCKLLYPYEHGCSDRSGGQQTSLLWSDGPGNHDAEIDLE